MLNTKYAQKEFDLINPTLNYTQSTIAALPVIVENKTHVDELVSSNMVLSRVDWDSFETSWDFLKHPLIRPVSTVADAFAQWKVECDNRFAQLKANEEELNRIFIDIYGLQDELTRKWRTRM